jgi:hypothetical protein
MMAEKKGFEHNDLLFLLNEVLNTADTMLEVNNGGTWDTFSCSEIEALGDVFRAAGRSDVRDFIIAEHKKGDNAEDLESHAYNEEGL